MWGTIWQQDGADSSSGRMDESIQCRRDAFTALLQERLVVIQYQQFLLHRDALCCEWCCTVLRHQRQQVGHRRLVADRAIGFAADESQVGDVVSLAGGVAASQQCLGENVMELQAVLTARVVQSNGKVAAPPASAPCLGVGNSG